MNTYRVVLDAIVAEVLAHSVRVTEGGALVFYMYDDIIRAFAHGAWQSVRNDKYDG
jgi:hypothetical protein